MWTVIEMEVCLKWIEEDIYHLYSRSADLWQSEVNRYTALYYEITSVKEHVHLPSE